MAQDGPPPSAEEAATLLAAARQAQRQGRRAAVGAVLRTYLVFWGLDWIAGYTLLQVWPGWPTLALWGVASLTLYVLPRRRAAAADLIVSGWEAPLRRAWWVILGGAAGCAVVAAPLPLVTQVLLLGAVWGIAYALYGVVAGDQGIAVLGGVIVALAALTHVLTPAIASALFGLTAGGATAVLGLARRRER